ncbi:MAG TPA: GerMN domain-containing protein [Vicinamibacterales bacterium]|nr:GerMN domain-containing protein [Vicinamibacterales bacterium]
MTRPSNRVIAAGAAALALLVWLLFWGVPSWMDRGPGASRPSADAPASEARRINATLFFVSTDAQGLVAVPREVPYGATPAEQARHIVAAQLGPAPASLHSPIPPGTALRGVFLSEAGEAFVDLSPEASANHPGGSMAELFTIYAIVNALTVSLPSVQTVQILIDGREVETLAGHVDLRHPLPKDTTWVKSP